jgi:hypothetical protein
LGKRFRHLTARGNNPHQVLVAIAREMAAFIWAITRKVRMTHYRGGAL